MSLFQELKRRNVFRVTVAYIIVGWLLLQVSDTLVPALHLPEWFHSGVAFIIILGFPIALIFAWAFELTPDGLVREHQVDRSESITRARPRAAEVLANVAMQDLTPTGTILNGVRSCIATLGCAGIGLAPGRRFGYQGRRRSCARAVAGRGGATQRGRGSKAGRKP